MDDFNNSVQALLLCLYLQVYFDTLDLEAENPNYLRAYTLTHSQTHTPTHSEGKVTKPDSTLNRRLPGHIHEGMSGIVSRFLQEKQKHLVEKEF